MSYIDEASALIGAELDRARVLAIKKCMENINDLEEQIKCNKENIERYTECMKDIDNGNYVTIEELRKVTVDIVQPNKHADVTHYIGGDVVSIMERQAAGLDGGTNTCFVSCATGC